MADSTLVLLFDIDGTLIESGGAGGGALLRALEHAFSVEMAQSVPLHGRTDLGIMSDMLVANGVEPSAPNIDRLCSKYFELLPDELETRPGRCLPGVEPLIARLLQQPEVVLGLLTGNMPRSAQQKLEHYGIWKHFDFGIFGDSVMHRPDLAGPALQKVNDHIGTELHPQSIVIIGDTPLDIELAERMQVRSLAVCTGGYERHELAHAHRVEDNLENTSVVFRWLCAA